MTTTMEPAATATQTDPAPIHASTPSPSIPAYPWRAHWLTVDEFARMMGRRPQTIYKWIRNDTLATFGIPMCRFRGSSLHSGRVFIQNIY